MLQIVISELFYIVDKWIDFVEIRTPSTLDTLWPIMMVMLYYDKIWFHSQRKFHITKHNKKSSTTATTMLRKWTAACLSVDFEEQLAQVAYNGILSKKEKAQKSVRYQDKFGGDAMMKDMKDPVNNFTFIIGRYSFDKLSIVRKIVGINAWNRTLTEQEMINYTHCSQIVLAEGNIINQNTTWFRTAPLVKEFQVDMDEMICPKSKQDVPAFIPVGGLSKADAVDLCHKFGANIGLAGEFNSEEDYAAYYKLVWSPQSKRFRDSDAFLNRGRVRIWLPYTLQTINGTNKVLHDVTGSEIGVDYWYSEGHAENTRLRNKGKDLLQAVMGIVPYKKNLNWNNQAKNTDSTSCLLHNSFHDTTTLGHTCHI